VKIQEELDIDVLVHGEPEVWSWYLLPNHWLNGGFFLVCKYGPKIFFSNFFCQFRGTTWLSTSENNYLALLSLPMGGCNPTDLAASNHPLSMVMWAVPSQWLFSGLQQLKVWPNGQWRECLPALLLFWTGPLLEMTSLGMQNHPYCWYASLDDDHFAVYQFHLTLSICY
jgi:hypothetical protein